MPIIMYERLGIASTFTIVLASCTLERYRASMI